MFIIIWMKKLDSILLIQTYFGLRENFIIHHNQLQETNIMMDKRPMMNTILLDLTLTLIDMMRYFKNKDLTKILLK